MPARRKAGGKESFNPLHCGAVVASASPASTFTGMWTRFQSPSLRGSGRFRRRRRRDERTAWKFQSPSLRGSGRFEELRPVSWEEETCFNPLHCGAVVASTYDDFDDAPSPYVSIPFIAGQWSLLVVFVVFATVGLCVSIPFIAGQWSLLVAGTPPDFACCFVSIPFIAGQWSLPTC